MGLEPAHHQVVSRPRPGGVPGREPQPGLGAGRLLARSASRTSPRTPSLRARVDSAYRELRDYLGAARTWASVHAGPLRVRPVAYFSAEFGIHESLPIYSGGLGVLAGDHLKSASDLGLPLVAVGLFYRESYFRQRIGRDGWQHAEYVRSPAELLPAQPALTPGRPADRHRGAAVARDAARAGLGDRGRAQQAAPARHRRRRQLRGEPPARRPPLLRRPAHPHPPGAAAGRGRRARAARRRHPLGRPAPQRGPQRLRDAGVHAPAAWS